MAQPQLCLTAIAEAAARELRGPTVERLSLSRREPILEIVHLLTDPLRSSALNAALERLGRLPRPLVLLLGLVLIAAIFWLDVATGPKLVFNVFYLLPVMLVAWVTASTAYGLVAVLATFLVGPLEAYMGDFHVYSLPVAVWNAGMRAAVFCIVLLLLAEVRGLIARLRATVVHGRAHRRRQPARLSRGRGRGRSSAAAATTMNSHSPTSTSTVSRRSTTATAT